jgi:hypothetical protein
MIHLILLIIISSNWTIQQMDIFIIISSNWTIQQMDIKNVFLHDFIDIDVYMVQPSCLKHPNFPNHV